MDNYKPLVFIVEDDDMYREMLDMSLKSNGFEDALSFSSGEACLNSLYRMPDIILLDYNLGGLNGDEVLKQIKSFNPDIQVVFLSAQEEVEIAVNALKYGAFDYVVKNETAFEKVFEIIGKIMKHNEYLEKSKSKKSFWRRLFR